MPAAFAASISLPPTGPAARQGGPIKGEGGWWRQVDGLAVICSGRPRFGLESSDTRAPEEVVAAAYRRHGVDFARSLTGEFVCALVDGAANRAFVAQDRMASRRLYFAQVGGRLAFGTGLQQVVDHAGIERRLSRQAIYEYLYFHMIPAPLTIVEGVSKLAGSQLLEVSGGSVRVRTYWQPEFRETTDRGMDAVGEDLLAALRGAVGRSVEGLTPESVGAFLSGGLDSSSVAGMLADVTNGAARTFTIGFPDKAYDESGYAEIAARHFGTRHHLKMLEPREVIDAIVAITLHQDEPFGNSSALPTYFCAAEARQAGVSTLLAGDGGDELFGGNSRYVKQGVFEIYGHVPAALRRSIIEPLLLGPVGLGKLPLLRKGASYVRQANVPLPDRLDTYNFLHRYAAADILTDDFLRGLDLERPIRHLRARYNELDGLTPLNRMLYLDWMRTLQDSDLVKVTSMCQHAGIDVRYPMLDAEVVDLSSRLPTHWKVRRGRLRHFYRHAVRGFLPQAVLTKRKHGFGLPFGHWARRDSDLRDLAHTNVRWLGENAGFRPEFLEQAIQLHGSDTPGYYGELVWILMVLGIWLGRHQ
ncbi:MAG: asparagine synthase [Ectothiorhodospiraceae bacterium]|nr:asparagine synthase [Ectothiorhodospiraceae bacterium]